MFPSPTGMKWKSWYPAPLAESVSDRFSEIKLSSSNFPTFTLSHGLFRRLSKRTFADSK